MGRWLIKNEGWARDQRVSNWGSKAQRVARYSYRFDAIPPTRTETYASQPGKG